MEDDFGEMVREAREHRGWSQEFLAARVGATQSTIDRIESGATRRSRILPEIAAALDLQIPGVSKPQQNSASSNLNRVTYVLPAELVERVNQYKQDVGIASDDEAVRRLLDDALKHRDNFYTITDRLMQKYKVLRSLREAAGYVLTNHPLVKSISFDNGDVSFVLTNGYAVTASTDGKAIIMDDDGRSLKFKRLSEPSWAHDSNVSKTDLLDDDIPF